MNLFQQESCKEILIDIRDQIKDMLEIYPVDILLTVFLSNSIVISKDLAISREQFLICVKNLMKEYDYYDNPEEK